ADLAGSTPMQRLLQGDVGSGKTVVALYALLRAVENGLQGALMAPTETLAEQHFLTVEPICAELGVRAGLLTGSVKGRGEDAQIVTRWIPEERAAEAYRRLRRLLDEGRQAYVVCPLVEESETSRARAAEQEAERLARAELRGFRVGCMHGRLRPAERRELMRRFKARELDVLVATTVIEVGVDVANATVMIVQEADRFGLAQLHQLRGRVGRGAEQSYCLLVSRAKEELTESAQARLQALCDTSDGFELAEVDLELRGGGA